jgi:hypothetical protein
MANTVSSTLKETLKRLEGKDIAIGTVQGREKGEFCFKSEFDLKYGNK